MNIDTHFFYTPKYFDMLVSSTGQLSDKKRFHRIIEIGKKNIWLAARCKNTCVNEEPEVVDWIVLRCSLLYRKFEDIQSLVALFEIKEFGVLALLLGLTNSRGQVNHAIINLMRNKNVEFSDAFVTIVELLDVSLGLKLFYRFIELGYIFDIKAYNTLLAKVKTLKDVQELTSLMSSSGIDADAMTYYNLLRREESFNTALVQFNHFKKIVDTTTQKDLVIAAYNTMLQKCEKNNDLQNIFHEFSTIYPQEDSQWKLKEAYFSTAIQLSKDEEEATNFFKTYKNLIIELIYKGQKKNPQIKDIITKREKKDMSNMLTTYLQKITKFSLPYDTFCEILHETLRIIVDELKIGISPLGYSIAIRRMIIKERSFIKGKEMIELMKKHNQKIAPFCFEQLFLLARDKDEINYVLRNTNCQKFEAKSIVVLISCVDKETALFLFERLKEENYPLNSFIYNAIIKNDSFHHSICLIEQMQLNGITPDIQTIQPLLRKWESIQDLANIIILAKKLKLDADEKAILAIVKRAKFQKLESELIDFSYENEYMHDNTFTPSWKQAILKASNYLI